MALEAMDEEEEIRMYINSSGGQPYSVFGVLDAMATIKPPIQTLGLGACYSYASLILVGWPAVQQRCGVCQHGCRPLFVTAIAAVHVGLDGIW
jgi:ATP-dependent protease ClpP protease subunit